LGGEKTGIAFVWLGILKCKSKQNFALGLSFELY